MDGGLEHGGRGRAFQAGEQTNLSPGVRAHHPPLAPRSHSYVVWAIGKNTGSDQAAWSLGMGKRGGVGWGGGKCSPKWPR